MGLDTGRSAPTDQEIVHLSSEALRRVIGVALIEWGRRLGLSPSSLAQDFAQEMAMELGRSHRKPSKLNHFHEPGYILVGVRNPSLEDEADRA